MIKFPQNLKMCYPLIIKVVCADIRPHIFKWGSTRSRFDFGIYALILAKTFISVKFILKRQTLDRY